MIILEALYFFLPAYFANMAPVFASRIFGDKFITSIDFNKTIGGKRIFGDHKTWRGLFSGIVVALLVVYLQSILYQFNFFHNISLIDYKSESIFIFGILLGFGALFGDIVKSFFKRRVGIKSGGSWPIFDQLDFVVGALLFVAIIYIPTWQHILILILFTPFLHWLTNVIGYKLGWKSNPW